MDQCLYKCGSGAPSTQEYHVYPASASNLQIVLERGIVCDKCNAYFSELENYFVHYHPGSAARLMNLGQTKKGKQPQYKSQAGTATREINEDASFKLQVPMSDVAFETKDDGTIVIKCTAKAREFDSVRISRVLGKIALEAVFAEAPSPGLNFDAYSSEYDPLRRYVRSWGGQPRFIWFAYKGDDGVGSHPQMGIIRGQTDSIMGVVCVIRLPGMHYILPLLPYLEAEVLQPMLPEWTYVTTPGMHKAKDLEATIPLHPVKEGEGMVDA
jgi:hypothetical protein